MKKYYYYINMAGVPFATIHRTEKKLEVLPKFWRELTEEEANKNAKGCYWDVPNAD